ncbi:histidine ammonia-lyase [bacterium]|nr:histidine ammonia-lyase [bacterium]
MTVNISGTSLTIEEVVRVARQGEPVSLTAEARQKVNLCRAYLEELVERGEAIYGVTTGIGEYARVPVPKELGEELQKRIIRSHSASVGDLLEEQYTRAGLLLRLNTLAMGFSGVRLELLNLMVEMLNRKVLPVVYNKGSIGASGDLVQLAQMGAVMIGEGEAFYKGERLPGAEALKRAGLAPLTLSYKEGLSIINGSQLITAFCALCCYDVGVLLKTAQVASALTVDSLGCKEGPFEEELHQVRPFPGQLSVAANIRQITQGTELMYKRSYQDAYSLRCIPQVLGAVYDTLQYARNIANTEINSAGDNPLLFPDAKKVLSGGNFHGEPIAFALDFLGIAVSEIANLAERHINRLLNPKLSGLPDFLMEGKGLNSGLMLLQYSAADLASENKTLAHPGSVDSIPVSADQEDHMSMGATSARTLVEIIKNTRAVIAIELICGSQALDFTDPGQAGTGTRAAYQAVRKLMPFLKEDTILYPFIEKVNKAVAEGNILKNVEEKIGPLK